MQSPHQLHLARFLSSKGISSVNTCPCVLSVADISCTATDRADLVSLAELLFESTECQLVRVGRRCDCPMKSTCIRGRAEGLFSFIKQCCKGKMKDKMKYKDMARELEKRLCALCNWQLSDTSVKVQFLTCEGTVERECHPAFNTPASSARKARHVCLPMEECGAIIATADRHCPDFDTWMLNTELHHIPQFNAVVLSGDTLQSLAFRMQLSVHGNACLCFSLVQKNDAVNSPGCRHMDSLDACIASGNVPLHHVVASKTMLLSGVFAFGDSGGKHNDNHPELRFLQRQATIKSRHRRAAVLQSKVLAESFARFMSERNLWGSAVETTLAEDFHAHTKKDPDVLQFHDSLKNCCPKHTEHITSGVFWEMSRSWAEMCGETLTFVGLHSGLFQTIPFKFRHKSVCEMLQCLNSL